MNRTLGRALSCSVMDDRSAGDRVFRRQALCAIGSVRRRAMKHVDDRIMPQLVPERYFAAIDELGSPVPPASFDSLGQLPTEAVALRDETPLHELLWSYAPERSGVPGEAGATALAKELRRRGFRFVGPTTVYSALQACGVVNDHIADCWVRQAVEDERSVALTT